MLLPQSAFGVVALSLDVAGPPLSRRLFCQQVCESLFPLFGRLCHALKKDWRALYWNSCTGTINLPPPWLWRASASLNNKRVVGWVKFSAHHAPKSKRGSAKMICLHGETPLIPRFNNRIYWGSCIGPAHLRKLLLLPEHNHAARSTRVSISLPSITKSIGLVKSASAPPSKALRFRLVSASHQVEPP